MTFYHIVSFKLVNPSGLPKVMSSFRALEKSCIRNGKPYIQSFKCGRQVSIESAHQDMQMTFLLEFANEEDLHYYINEDKAHDEFKNSLKGDMKPSGSFVVDFQDGDYVQ